MGIMFGTNALSQTTYDESKIQESTLIILEQMSNDIFSFTASMGESGAINKQYYLFQELQNASNEMELFELTNHPNPVVRSYSYWSLLKLNSSLSEKVLIKNQCDKTVIRTRISCLSGESSVILILLILTSMETEKSLNELSVKYNVNSSCE